MDTFWGPRVSHTVLGSLSDLGLISRKIISGADPTLFEVGFWITVVLISGLHYRNIFSFGAFVTFDTFLMLSTPQPKSIHKK